MRKRLVLSTIFFLSLFLLVSPTYALVVFSDDFSGDLSKWTVVSGSWAIESGELHAETIDGLLASGQYVEDATIEVKMKIIDYGVAPNYWVGMLVRATNPTDNCWASGSGYLIYLRYNGMVELYTYLDAVIASADTGITPSSFVTMKVVLSGSNIKVYINDVLYIDVNHNRYSSGYFSLKNYVAHAHFDDVVVNNPNTDPNPGSVPEFGVELPAITSIAAGAYMLVKRRLFKKRE